jgi:argininosuccinate lyase
MRSSFRHLFALAGNPFLVDRQFMARELGMVGGVCPNSMDAVSDRECCAVVVDS